MKWAYEKFNTRYNYILENRTIWPQYDFDKKELKLKKDRIAYVLNNSDKNICKKICDIKQLLYLAKSFVNVNVFLRRLLSQLLEMNYNNEQKTKLVKEFTEYDIMINKSFRDLLCLEGLLISILTLI